MSDTQLIPGQQPGPAEPSSYLTPFSSANLPIGTPVYFEVGVDDTVAAAKANVIATSYQVGALIRPVSAGSRGLVQTRGPMTLTMAEWDALTGGVGGLTRGPYYLSQSTAGKIQSAVPTGAYASLYGYALSSTQLVLAPQPQFPVEQS